VGRGLRLRFAADWVSIGSLVGHMGQCLPCSLLHSRGEERREERGV
jgi:hypothetical protein